MKSFTNNKSPGLDGYTMEFFKASWSLIKGEIKNIFIDFHKNDIINRAVNETFIALIAKKEKCDLPSDYKLISLTTTLYNLIAKILAERLKHTLPNIIS